MPPHERPGSRSQNIIMKKEEQAMRFTRSLMPIAAALAALYRLVSGAIVI